MHATKKAKGAKSPFTPLFSGLQTSPGASYSLSSEFSVLLSCCRVLAEVGRFPEPETSFPVAMSPAAASDYAAPPDIQISDEILCFSFSLS